MSTVLYTDSAAAVDVLLRVTFNCEDATEDDVQPLCAIKRCADALAVAAHKQPSGLFSPSYLTEEPVFLA